MECVKDGHILNDPNSLQIWSQMNLYFESFHTALEMGSQADWWVSLKIVNSVLDLFCSILIKIKI